MSSYRTGGSGPYYRPSFFGGFRFFPPVIKSLLISNTAIWLFVGFLLAPFTVGGFQIGGDRGFIMYYFALWPLDTNFWPWQLVTYMFMHGGLGHLFFNMLALWMFGMELENTWGSKRFLVYYLVCGLGAGVANLFVAPLVGPGAPTVGASGAVFGVLLAFGMLFPNRPVYLYFLLPIKSKYFIAGFIVLELFYGVTGSATGVAHFAHLGGAAVGFVYMLAMMDTIPLRQWWARTFGKIRNPFEDTSRVIRRDDDVIHDAKFYDIKTGRPSEDGDEVTQEVIDSILDKISTGGYQSLTDKEKRILNEASRKIH